MEVKKTISSIFFVPTFKISRDDLKLNNFINAYVIDKRRDVQYKDAAYLLFRPDDLSRFKEFVDKEYERTKLLIDDYNYEDNHVVLVYQFNPDFLEDYDLIKSGKYSETSSEFQNLFPKVIKIIRNGSQKDELSLQHRIFNKTDDLKSYWEDKLNVKFSSSMEVWQGFFIENEQLDMDKIKEYV